MICNNISVNAEGHLCFAGQDTVKLAEQYSTPLYLFDENKIRENCRLYLNAMKKYFGENSLPLYASKAASFKRIYGIMKEEGMGVDVVSSGEIYTALLAGFPMDKVYFHGNNKTDSDLFYAVENGVGCIVVDKPEELSVIDSAAKAKGIKQNVLIRLTPGIDPHTYEAVATGKVDSKFGAAIETGAAKDITEAALQFENIELCGFHCHVGSQVFDSEVFISSLKIMLSFIKEVQSTFGFETKVLDLGGGYGVRYVESDPVIDIDANIAEVAKEFNAECKRLSLTPPSVHMEPGRSIVADAGMTLYTVGTNMTVKGYKSYISIDGGMTDNPRFALYGSEYTIFNALRAKEKNDYKCSLVGRCCESGDIIAENIKLPQSTQRGDIIAVATTGAYNYSMASNYNRLCRPPVVMLKDGDSYIAVKRETLEHLTALDV